MSPNIHDITICKLPYQDHPFVHGVRDGKDVWLKNNGEWTETDGDPDVQIPYNSESERQAERQAERREFWRYIFLLYSYRSHTQPHLVADAALAEFDKRFMNSTAEQAP